jgi:hypothetical protein
MLPRGTTQVWPGHSVQNISRKTKSFDLHPVREQHDLAHEGRPEHPPFLSSSEVDLQQSPGRPLQAPLLHDSRWVYRLQYPRLNESQAVVSSQVSQSKLHWNVA